MKFQAIFFFLFAIFVVIQARPHGCDQPNETPSDDPSHSCPMGEEEPFEGNIPNDEPSTESSSSSESDETSSGASIYDESYMTSYDEYCN
uniref:Secreted protein n=1 Tax=Glossina pallidipes TaxID=7398 RepID=A0A1B0A023_GLOPL